MRNNPFAEIALDGSLLLAAPIALLAGLISFLSPCVLPLVPGWLGYVTGLSDVALEERSRGRMVVGALLFGSGMAAATAVFQALSPGDHVVASKVMYWALRSWLLTEATRWGLKIDFVETDDLQALKAAVKPFECRNPPVQTVRRDSV